MEFLLSKLDAFMARLIPAHFSSSRYAFQAKVLSVFSLLTGSMSILVLLGLIFSEGSVANRRLVTVALASLLVAIVPIMHWVKKIEVVASYVVVNSLALVWYVDFNNHWLAPVVCCGPFHLHYRAWCLRAGIWPLPVS
jgi:hypothetical protein